MSICRTVRRSSHLTNPVTLRVNPPAIALTCVLFALPRLSEARECAYPSSEALTLASVAIVTGPTRKQLCINGQQFRNIRPATIVWSLDGNLVSLTGTITRPIAGLPDDIVSYKVNYEDGRPDLKHAEFHIDQGGLVRLVRSLASVASTVVLSIAGLDSRAESVADAADDFGTQGDNNSWRGQVVAMVEQAALHAASLSAAQTKTSAASPEVL